MAGEWIKMRTNLWNDPRISQICDVTSQAEATVIGAMYWLWATADEHTQNGFMPGLSCASIDRKTGVQGFANALVTIGWLSANADGVTLERFQEHNGASAKSRAQTAKRVANHKSNAQVTQHNEIANATSVTSALPREEKNKNINSSLSERSPDAPAKPKKWGTDEDHTAARWIFSMIRKLNESAKEPNWDGWANDIRLMRENDKRTHHQICELFKWANSDTFWKSNILSPSKLREKWDQLAVKFNGGNISASAADITAGWK